MFFYFENIKCEINLQVFSKFVAHIRNVERIRKNIENKKNFRNASYALWKISLCTCVHLSYM